MICNVNDDPSVARSTSNSSLAFTGNPLPSFESSRRVERLLPPMGFWNTSGVSKFDYNIFFLYMFIVNMFLKFKIQIVGEMN